MPFNLVCQIKRNKSKIHLFAKDSYQPVVKDVSEKPATWRDILYWWVGRFNGVCRLCNSLQLQINVAPVDTQARFVKIDSLI